jgi:uncharacterized membrane protein YgcG
MKARALPPNNEWRRRRWVRLLAPVAVVGAAVGSVAIAEAATQSGNDSPRDLVERAARSTTSTSQPDDNGGLVGDLSGGNEVRTETFTPAALADGETRTFTAGAAGMVTINRTGNTLTVVGVGNNPGWTAFTERGSGPSVEVEFRSATARIDVEAEFEDGGVQVRVRERVAAADNSTNSTVTAPRVDNAGPGSIDDGRDDDALDDDDDGRFDDSSGPGSSSSDDSGSNDSRSGSSGSGSSGSGSSGSGSSGSGSSGSGNSGSGHSGSDDD